MTKKKVRRGKQGARARQCGFKGCERPPYALGLCQTHRRQLRDQGKLTPIRPYRARDGQTVKLGGLRLSAEAALKLQDVADARAQSIGATIAQIVELWHHRRRARS